MKRRLILLVIAVALVLLMLPGVGLWIASNELLSPSWKGEAKGLAICGPELRQRWGERCGNLRDTRALNFSEIKIRSLNGYEMPAWLVRAADNNAGTARGAIILIHGGGSDRREMTRYAPFFLERRLDVLLFDLGCHGEAPCPVPGLTYGQRESRDVLSAYLHLVDRYKKVYAMGTSVGATSLLIALPGMPALAGAIVDSPIASFQKLIEEAPESRSMPRTFTRLLISLAMLRGTFDDLLTPENSLHFVKTTPIFFIHSTKDVVAPYTHTHSMATAYLGPKQAWFPKQGGHGEIWNLDRDQYEKRLKGFLTRLNAKTYEIGAAEN